MANGYYGDKAVKLPNMFQSPGQTLATRVDDINRSNERQFELDYRAGKDNELQEWKKLELIQELTDLSKYRTGSDVADAVGYNKMNQIYQKYTSSAGVMSPAELQANIQKDMGGIISGMNAAKEELNLAEEQMKMLKQKFPSLDIATLLDEYRAEILGRRLKGDNFENPLLVGPSLFDISNPDKLSQYVKGNTRLTESIQNPKGAETMKVFKGSPSAYTEYTAKLNPWKKEGFDRSKLEGGFMTTKGEPKLKIKASALPGVTNPNGQPFMVMDEDIYKKFSEDESMNIELTAATRNKYKDYDRMSNEDKSIAKRNVLYEKIKELDPSDYYPSDVKSPPRINVNTGSKPSKEDIIKNTPLDLSEYRKEGDWYDVTRLAPGIKVKGLPTGETFAANSIMYNPDTKQVKYKESGTGGKTVVEYFDTFRQNIATINTGVDLSFIDRLKVTPKPNNSSATTTPIKKEILRKDIPAKAKAAGYSTSEYEALLNKNGVTIKD